MAPAQGFAANLLVPAQGFVANLLEKIIIKRGKNKSELVRMNSQWIVAQRPLSAPTIPRFDWIVCPGFPRPKIWTALNTDPFNRWQGTCDIRPKPFTFVPVLMGRKTNTAYQHGF